MADRKATPTQDPRVYKHACSEFASSELIRIHVDEGEQLRSFHAHKDIITSRSDYFKCSLRGDWVGAQDKKISFPDVNTEIFSYWLQLAYFDTMADVYTLSDRLMDIRTKNLVIQGFIARSRAKAGHFYLPSPEIVNRVYHSGSYCEPLKRLLVDMYVQGSMPAPMRKLEDLLPKAFFHDLTIALVQLAPVVERTAGFNDDEHILKCDGKKYFEKMEVEEHGSSVSASDAKA